MRGGKLGSTCGWASVSRWAGMLAVVTCLGAGATLVFAQVQHDQVATDLLRHGVGSMFFRAEGSVVGSVKIWLLIGLSVVTLALIVQRSLETRRSVVSPDALVRKVREAAADRKYEDAIAAVRGDGSLFGAVAYATLKAGVNGYGAMLRALASAEDVEVTRRLRRLEPLNVIGNVAPMIGLLGTVYGIILAFQEVVSAGGRPSPVELAGGIGTALVATFWGLLVAIPALAAYAMLRNRLDGLATEAVTAVEEIVAMVRQTEAESANSQAGGAVGGSP